MGLNNSCHPPHQDCVRAKLVSVKTLSDGTAGWMLSGKLTPSVTAMQRGRGETAMPDLAYAALMIGIFAVLVLMLRGLERV